jgi:hypothetical protein
VCNTAAVRNAGARFSIIFGAVVVSVFAFFLVHSSRRDAAVRAVFADHAAALRARAYAAAPGSAERAALEAEAADVEGLRLLLQIGSAWPKMSRR